MLFKAQSLCSSFGGEHVGVYRVGDLVHISLLVGLTLLVAAAHARDAPPECRSED
ncbi:MAG: hypothetical protein ABR606_06085 [Vicinamibacterales bacterium]